MLRHVPGRRRTSSLPAAVLAVTLTATLLGGCSGSEPAAEPASQQASAPDQSQEEDERAATDAKRSSDDLDPAGAIATVSTQADGGSLDIHLMEAEVVGKLLRVRLWYQPGTDYEPEEYSVYDLGGDHSPDVFLLDPVNLRKYRVVEAGQHQPLESNSVHTEGSADQPLVMTHYFAAPPPDVETLNLNFGNTSWPSIDFEVR